MRSFVTRALLALCALPTVPAMTAAQVQQARGALIADSARFRGAEWQVIPIVRLDSSKTQDTMAVREIRLVRMLAPGRFVYTGKLTKDKKWALFGVVDGVTRRLVISGQDFFEPGGTKKKAHLEFWLEAGPGRAVFPVSISSRLPNAVFVTDGESMKQLLAKGDSVTIGSRSVLVDDIGTRGFEA